MNEYYKYPKIPYHEKGTLKGTLYEKINGSNCQVRVVNSRIIPGTRSKKCEDYTHQFPWMRQFHIMAINNESFLTLPENYVLYCEFVQNDRRQLNFIDLYEISSNRFIDYETAKTTLKERDISGLKFLEPIDQSDSHSQMEIKLLLERYFRENASFEGFVAKDYENQVFLKVVAEQVPELFNEIVGEGTIENTQRQDLNRDEIIELLVKKASEKGRTLHSEVIGRHLGSR